VIIVHHYAEWWYGPVLCKVAPYLQGIAVSSSVNTLAAVALERYACMSEFYRLTFALRLTVKSPSSVFELLNLVQSWSEPFYDFLPRDARSASAVLISEVVRPVCLSVRNVNVP